MIVYLNLDLEQKVKLDTLDAVFKASIESYKTTLQLDPNNDRALLYLLDEAVSYREVSLLLRRPPWY